MPATALHIAAKAGELDEAQKFMVEEENKARVNEVDSTGWTALHWAASRGREQMVEYLLANKADATIVTEDSWSPVHDAARAGSEKCLRMLKEAGANMVLKTSNGSTPLHYAAQYDKIDVVKYLLNLDSDSAEGTGIVDVANSTGQTALHVASRHGKEKAVEALIAFNANTLLQDKINRTAQHLASGTAESLLPQTVHNIMNDAKNGPEHNFPAVVAMLEEAAVVQREQQVSSAELELKNAEEAEMMGDKAKLLDALSKAAVAFALAGDNRADGVNEKVSALKASK